MDSNLLLLQPQEVLVGLVHRGVNVDVCKAELGCVGGEAVQVILLCCAGQEAGVEAALTGAAVVGHQGAVAEVGAAGLGGPGLAGLVHEQHLLQGRAPGLAGVFPRPQGGE